MSNGLEGFWPSGRVGLYARSSQKFQACNEKQTGVMTLSGYTDGKMSDRDQWTFSEDKTDPMAPYRCMQKYWCIRDLKLFLQSGTGVAKTLRTGPSSNVLL